jgi:hypothetical protein
MTSRRFGWMLFILLTLSITPFIIHADDQPNWCFAGEEWSDRTCETTTDWQCGYYNDLYDRGLADGVPDACYAGYIETKGIDNWCYEPGPFADGICNDQPTQADVDNYWECGWWGAQVDMGNYSLEEMAAANLLCLGLYIEVRMPELLIADAGDASGAAGGGGVAGTCVTGFADLLLTGEGLNYFYSSNNGSCSGSISGDIYVVYASSESEGDAICSSIPGFGDSRSLMAEGSWNVPGAYSCYCDGGPCDGSGGGGLLPPLPVPPIP